MGSNLGFIPADRDYQWLSVDIKFALRKQYGDPIDAILDSQDLPYLRGIRDAGLTEAELLITAIGKHDRIEIREIF